MLSIQIDSCNEVQTICAERVKRCEDIKKNLIDLISSHAEAKGAHESAVKANGPGQAQAATVYRVKMEQYDKMRTEVANKIKQFQVAQTDHIRVLWLAMT